MKPEIRQLQTVVRNFVRDVVEPVAPVIEEEDRIPEDVLEQAKELGLFGLSIPVEYGGLGLNMTEKCLLLEELGKTHNGFTSLIGAHTGIGTVGSWSWEVRNSGSAFCRKWRRGSGSAPSPCPNPMRDPMRPIFAPGPNGRGNGMC